MANELKVRFDIAEMIYLLEKNVTKIECNGKRTKKRRGAENTAPRLHPLSGLEY